MKVFIGWSGVRGKARAEALEAFLVNCLGSHVSPLISVDIPKGMPWPNELDKQLSEAEWGIFCITRNSSPSWICYEAGVLKGKPVCPLIFEIPAEGLPDPLRVFQKTCYKCADRAEMKKMMDDLYNAAFDEDKKAGIRPLFREDFERNFETAYHKLKSIFPYTMENFKSDLEALHAEASARTDYGLESLYYSGRQLLEKLYSEMSLLEKARELEKYRNMLPTQAANSEKVELLYRNTEVLTLFAATEPSAI